MYELSALLQGGLHRDCSLSDLSGDVDSNHFTAMEYSVPDGDLGDLPGWHYYSICSKGNHDRGCGQHPLTAILCTRLVCISRL